MGVFDFVTSGVKAVTAPITNETRAMVIRRSDELAHLVVYKWPNQNIIWGSQLNVRQDECAIFVRDNAVMGVIGMPGDVTVPSGLASAGGRVYTLESRNIPFLHKITDYMSGGNLFTAEIFFVKTTPIYNPPENKGLTFGDMFDPMEDPELGESFTLRINGSFILQIVDPVRFVTEYYGQAAGQTDNALVFGLARAKFKAAAKSVVGDIVNETQTSLGNFGRLRSLIKPRLEAGAPDLERIGCKVIELVDFNMSFTPEDNERYTEAKRELGSAQRKKRIARDEAEARQYAIDQAGGYQQYVAGQMMVGAGEGMAKGGGGGVASLGAQMAMGVGMAGAFAPFAQGMAQPQYAAPPAQAPAPAAAGGVIRCTHCNANVPPGKFCQECGSPMATPQRRFCTGCGKEVGSAKFCAGCGTPAPGAGA